MKYNVNKTNPYIREPMWIQLTKSNFKFFLSIILGYRPVVNSVCLQSLQIHTASILCLVECLLTAPHTSSAH